MKAGIRFLLILLILGEVLYGEVVASFVEIHKPNQIHVDNGQIFICQRGNIFVYSSHNYQLIRQFGQLGEGPGEFKRYAHITPVGNDLLINSMGKVSLLKKDGTLIKEVKTRGEYALIFPVKDNYVGRGFRIARSKKDKINYKTLNLLDASLNNIKEVFKQELDWQQGKGTKLFHLTFHHKTHQGRIYMAGTRDFVIDVFDERGQFLRRISRKYERVKITDYHKKQVMDFFKRTRDNYAYWQKNAKFAKHFPAIRIIIVADNHLYIQTHKVKNGNYEIVIYDLKGKYIKTSWIRLIDKELMIPFPYTIKNNQTFQLVENAETEKTDLHIYDLK